MLEARVPVLCPAYSLCHRRPTLLCGTQAMLEARVPVLCPAYSPCHRRPTLLCGAQAMLEAQVPGCINFIDARTKWFDNAVIDATNARGIKQASN